MKTRKLWSIVKMLFWVTGATMFVSSCSDKKTDNGDSDSISDSHEWVDLGLPSGTKWATMNVGANQFRRNLQAQQQSLRWSKRASCAE